MVRWNSTFFSNLTQDELQQLNQTTDELCVEVETFGDCPARPSSTPKTDVDRIAEIRANQPGRNGPLDTFDSVDELVPHGLSAWEVPSDASAEPCDAPDELFAAYGAEDGTRIVMAEDHTESLVTWPTIFQRNLLNLAAASAPAEAEVRRLLADARRVPASDLPCARRRHARRLLERVVRLGESHISRGAALVI